jgi:hypothetical protein
MQFLSHPYFTHLILGSYFPCGKRRSDMAKKKPRFISGQYFLEVHAKLCGIGGQSYQPTKLWKYQENVFFSFEVYLNSQIFGWILFSDLGGYWGGYWLTPKGLQENRRRSKHLNYVSISGLLGQISKPRFVNPIVEYEGNQVKSVS